ncbi:MAG: pantoate--beta-alanine ligase [Desulforhopalus sp.]
MKIVSSLPEIHKLSNDWKKRGLKVALVPTMGCLHDGHLSLMRIARKYADRVIVSIFVNPMQFGPNEDFDAYPRQFQVDCKLADSEGVNAIFSPDPEQMYGSGFQTAVIVSVLSKGMCGTDRPGHFDGVATVVTKLFNLTSPDIAVFGEKDFQQLAVIRRLIRDLNQQVEIVGAPIVRESDGLAMSSRNKYLEGDWRQKATCLYRSILAAKNLVAESHGEMTAAIIVDQTKNIITASGAKLEYAVVVNESTLENESAVTPHSVLAVAAKFNNRVRLIDNAKLLRDVLS